MATWPPVLSSVEQSLLDCDVHSLDCDVHSLDCDVHSLDCDVHSLDCDVHSLDCDVYSLDWSSVYNHFNQLQSMLYPVLTNDCCCYRLCSSLS